MDYEKAYKDIVAKVKKAHLFAQTDSTKNVLEDILPELRESEDERIRRSLVEYHRKLYERNRNDETAPFHRDILTYLEKQKEQKPNIELIQRSWYMEGYHDGEFGKEPMWIIKTGEGGPKHELNPKYGQPLADELKPAECSKEDEEILDGIINTLDRLGYAEFCKSSREEDIEEERFYYKEIQFLKRLKSLRPSWKPSEEHLSALLAVFNDPNNIGSQTCQLTLADLYEQLKQL